MRYRRRARELAAATSRPAPLGQVGRRVGAAALGLALVVPAAAARRSTARSSASAAAASAAAAGGGNPVAVFNPIIDLRRQPAAAATTRPVIRVQRQADVPADGRAGQVHRRQVAAERSSRCRATTTTSSDGLPAAAGPRRRDRAATSPLPIEIFDLSQAWLPLPYPAAQVTDIDGTWLYDAATLQRLRRPNSSTQQLTYKVTALDVTPDRRGAARRRGPTPSSMRTLPAGCRADIAPRSWTPARAGDHRRRRPPTTRRVALQNWLRDPSEFSYNRPSTRRSATATARRRSRVPARPAGLLRALRLDDGRDGPQARHPGAGRGRLHPRPATARRARTSSACTTRTPGRSCTSQGVGLGARSSRPRAGRRRSRRAGPGPRPAAGPPTDQPTAGRRPRPTATAGLPGGTEP